MSWSAQYNLQEDGELVLAFESGLGTKEADMQHDAALMAFANVLDFGALGDFYKYTYTLTLSGHANPGHEPTDGWANDQLSMVIAQTGLRKEDENEGE